MEEKIKVLSLFSSGGVAEAHLEYLGIEILLANEIRKDRCKFYKHLYPKTEMIEGDNTRLTDWFSVRLTSCSSSPNSIWKAR